MFKHCNSKVLPYKSHVWQLAPILWLVSLVGLSPQDDDIYNNIVLENLRIKKQGHEAVVIDAKTIDWLCWQVESDLIEEAHMAKNNE